jgi:hypothetical protein
MHETGTQPEPSFLNKPQQNAQSAHYPTTSVALPSRCGSAEANAAAAEGSMD